VRSLTEQHAKVESVALHLQISTACAFSSWNSTTQAEEQSPAESFLLQAGQGTVAFASKVPAQAVKLEGAHSSPHHPNAIVLESRALRLLFTKLRNRETPVRDFAYFGNRLMAILSEEALAYLPATQEVTVTTPCGKYDGLESPIESDLAAVSIVRAGDSLLRAIRKVVPGIAVGKVLIQRDETTKEKVPILIYEKLPKLLAEKQSVLLVDPMLATGGSACKAIDELVKAGVDPTRIVFVNVVCCPEGLRRMAAEWPQVRIITAAVDEKLNSDKYIVPGLGDFGDRYFGTED